MKKKWLKIINILLILGAIGLVILLVNKNVPYKGSIIVEMDFEKDQSMITRLGPEVRVKLEEDYASVLESPVYFDLRAMPWFNQAQVYIIFKEQGQKLEGIGPQVGPGWQYEVKTPLLVSQDDDWQVAVFNFNLAEVYQQKNIKRFLISTTNDSGELQIKTLKVILNR